MLTIRLQNILFWTTLLIFVPFELFCFQSNQLTLITSSVLFLTVPLLFIFLIKRTTDLIAVSIYFFISIQFSIQAYFPITEYFSLLISFFMPLFLLVYYRPFNNHGFPYTFQIVLFATGFFLSFVYFFYKEHGGQYAPFLYDIQMFVGIFVLLSIFYLLVSNTIHYKQIINVVIISGLILISIVFIIYMKESSLSSLFDSRFGSVSGFNPNLISSYFDLIFPLSFFMILEAKQKRFKIYYSLITMVFFCAILMTGSRGSLAGLLIVLLFFICKSRSLILISTLLVLITLITLLFGEHLITRLFSPSYNDMYSTYGRIELIKSAFKTLKENNFIFGVGMNNFSQLKFNNGFPIWFDSAKAMSSHNEFLEFWLGWGLLGFIGWLSLFGQAFYNLIRKFKSEQQNYCYATFFALLSFFLHGFFDSVIGNFAIMFIVFTLLAIAAYLPTSTNMLVKCNREDTTPLCISNDKRIQNS